MWDVDRMMCYEGLQQDKQQQSQQKEHKYVVQRDAAYLRYLYKNNNIRLSCYFFPLFFVRFLSLSLAAGVRGNKRRLNVWTFLPRERLLDSDWKPRPPIRAKMTLLVRVCLCWCCWCWLVLVMMNVALIHGGVQPGAIVRAVWEMSEASVLQFHLGSSLAYSVEILQLSTTISFLCFITSLNLAVVMLVAVVARVMELT